MTLTANDLQDLARLLEQHPQSRAQLRTLLITEDLRTLPERFDRLTGIVEQLAQAQQRTEERLEQLAADVRELTANVNQLTIDVRALTEAHKRMEDRLGTLVGFFLESRYREHAAGYFGRWLRRARAVDPVTLEPALEETLAHEDLLDVLRLDLLVSGRWRALPEAPEAWLAVEVAAVLDGGDVARAWRRASLLRQAGYRAVPVVAGERITEDAQASARAQTVGVVLDGQGVFDTEELAVWLTEGGP